MSTRLDALRARLPWLRHLFWTGVAVIVWTLSSTFVQDLLVFGAFAYALLRPARGLAAWKTPAGLAFAVLLLLLVVSLPFSVDPATSWKDFTRLLELLAGVYAIPFVFNSRARIEKAMIYSATAIALTLGYDLIRLTWHLGRNLLAGAHTFTPFILNHPNVASLMAGASVFVFVYALWSCRKQPLPALGSLAGLLVCLAYLVVDASRGPQLAFVAAGAFWGFLLPGRRSRTSWLILLVAGGTVLFLCRERINPRLGEKASMRNLSERTTVWRHTWELAKQHPFFGHGYGKRVFTEVYYGSHPPEAKFRFPHAHQFWLKLLFEFGWAGVLLNLAAWLMLAAALLRYIGRQPDFSAKLLPGTVALLLLFVHLYGLGDYPDNIAQLLQFWLVPVALALIAD